MEIIFLFIIILLKVGQSHLFFVLLFLKLGNLCGKLFCLLHENKKKDIIIKTMIFINLLINFDFKIQN